MMTESEIQKFIGTPDLTIVEAMKLMDNNGSGILFIVNEKKALKSSLTDGDVRRWLIKTGKLDTKIESLLNNNPRYLFFDDRDKVYDYMEEQRIRVLPIVDKSMRIKDIVLNQYRTSDDFVISDELADTQVIIMAGGKGSRLYPYTKILPKPLIPIGDVPILERIINRLHASGVKEFFITINYKKEIIKSYFGESPHDYKINFVEETQPLGTAGSISLIKRKFSSPVIITNCDILIQADYGQILKQHQKSGNQLTIVSSLKNTIIPYGVLHSGKEGLVQSMEEKPQLSYFINTGMYIIEPKYLDWIPKDSVYNMTDLAEKMINNGLKVGMYPISENSFLDMGEFTEMKKMEERITAR